MSRKFAAAITILFVSYSADAEIIVQPVELAAKGNNEVSAGGYSYFEITLEAQDKLQIRLGVSGGIDNAIDVWVLDLANFQRFRDGQRFSYQKGTGGRVVAKTNYEFIAPSTNLYYLVLDNKKSFTKRSVETRAFRQVKGVTDWSKSTKEFYSKLYYQFLRRLFEFPDFNVYIGLCGAENAFSTPDIIICSELNTRLFSEGNEDAIIFVFLHEAAHSLLQIWDYPLYDNEDVADEMAAAILLLADRPDIALVAARYWASKDFTRDDALSRIWLDERHAISPQRARNLIAWVNDDDELTRRWLNLLIPRLSNEALDAASNDKSNTAHAGLATAELLKRRIVSEQ